MATPDLSADELFKKMDEHAIQLEVAVSTGYPVIREPWIAYTTTPLEISAYARTSKEAVARCVAFIENNPVS
jgi:hypothetical protein